MAVSSDIIAGLDAPADRADIEAVFRAQYARLARVIARVIKDPGRSEELAVEVFLKWSAHPSAHGEHASAWLYQTAVRMALDELRRQARRDRFERLVHLFGASPTPEDVRGVREQQQKVRTVIGRLRRRDAELLVLRSDGLTYDELAATLHLNPASVGTLLGRAQRAFRKEYVKRYGDA